MDWVTFDQEKDGMTTAQEDLLADLFMAQFDDKYHNPRMDKFRSLYRLSKLAKGGNILELGTYHGGGAIACGWGAQASGRHVQVYTIDDYVKKKEWIGYGVFVPEDKDVFLKNIEKAGVKEDVHLVQMEADEAQKWWMDNRKPIALLFWDLGGQRLFGDFVKWHTFIEVGGIFAVHDTADCKFGFTTVKNVAEAAGVWKYEGQMPGFVYLLRRLA